MSSDEAEQNMRRTYRFSVCYLAALLGQMRVIGLLSLDFPSNSGCILLADSRFGPIQLGCVDLSVSAN